MIELRAWEYEDGRAKKQARHDKKIWKNLS